MQSETTPRLEVRSLSKSFGATRVLDDVSFEIRPGEVLALMGQNGSGKSTLIKILAGFHSADPNGSVLVDGADRKLGDPDDLHAAGVRFVHQDLGLVTSMSVMDNLALGHGYSTGFGNRISWSRQRAAAAKALREVGYEMDVRRLVEDLQPVERTAVAIARAIQREDGAPLSVLVLDEPTATMPTAEVERLFAIIDEVKRQGVGILYVSHHLDEVFELADRVVVLVNGRRVATRPVVELNRASLVELMTGGAVDEGRRRLASPPGDIRLSVDGLAGTQLRSLDLEVKSGEIVGIAGVTGSGREEVCELVFGSRSRRGAVRVAGRKLAPSRPDAAAEAGVALVPANRLRDGIVLGLNVRENLNLTTVRKLARFGRIRSRDDREQSARISKQMSVVAPSIEAPIEALSGGNQQKVVLGKWLETEPSVLLLDEPTQGVDIGAKAQLHDLIDSASGAGVAVLVSSSDETELERLCDRVIVLRHGIAVRELSGGEIRARRLVRESMGIAQ